MMIWFVFFLGIIMLTSLYRIGSPCLHCHCRRIRHKKRPDSPYRSATESSHCSVRVHLRGCSHPWQKKEKQNACCENTVRRGGVLWCSLHQNKQLGYFRCYGIERNVERNIRNYNIQIERKIEFIWRVNGGIMFETVRMKFWECVC